MKSLYLVLFLVLSVLMPFYGTASATEYYPEVDDDLLSGHYFVNETLLSIIFEDENGKVGFYDKESGFMQSPCYDEVYDFTCEDSHYPILVGLDNHYGYVDRSTGKIVIPLQYSGYTSCSEFLNGFALVVTTTIDQDGYDSDKLILIDAEGQQVVFPDDISPDGYVQDNGLLVVSNRLNDLSILQFGLCNTRGEVIVYPQYDWICEFQNGFASFRQNGRWGHMDEQGNIIVAPQFVLCEGDKPGYYFQDDGTATLNLVDGTCVVIDVNGNMIHN